MEASGFAQGTTYSVIYFNEGKDYQYQIDSLLLAFDRVLSTYQETSYISKWNRNETAGLDQPQMFKEVMKRAKEVSLATSGSFDITVTPLMAYWFDRDLALSEIDSSKVDSIINFVGMEKIVESNNDYVKSDSSLQVDVNAIAQGYSVDVLSRFLESEGVFNYLIEIGGEVRASGVKPNNESWRVGIDRPDQDENLERELALSIELNDQALATSGNYRKFKEIDGQKYGHTLNPVTGYPATTDVLSATVIANDCMSADAYATACLVLGFERAKALIQNSEELEAVLIYSSGGEVKVWKSEKLAAEL